MKKIKRQPGISDIVLVMSAVSFWGMVMPANLYGILGIPVVSAAAFFAALNMEKPLEYIKEQFHMLSLIPLAVIYYILLTNFYKRWLPSGIFYAVAGIIGISNTQLLAAADILLGVCALLFCLFLCAMVCGKKNIVSFRLAEKRKNTEKKIGTGDMVFCLLITLCFSLLLALNPWSGGYPGTDSTVFLYIGKMMGQGAVPYVDLFDHKGIVLYLLEWLGAVLTPGSFTGMWLVEVLHLFAMAVLVLRITSLFTEKKGARYLTAMLCLFVLDCYLAYEGGNLTEEFALPWMMLSLYIFLKYFMTQEYRIQEIVLLGISFTISFFLRANMIGVWAAFLPVVFVEFIWKKRWKDIGICIVGFCGGMAAVLVPLGAYMLAAGCLDEMLQYYFVFNFGYSDSEGSVLSILSTMWFLITLSFSYVLVHFIALRMCWRDRIFRLNLWFTVVSLGLAAMSGRPYYHYGITLIPTMVVPCILVMRELADSISLHKEKYMTAIAAGFFVIQLAVSVLGGHASDMSELAAYLQENTEKTEDVLIIGNSCNGYLESNRTTKNKFFYQTPPINISDELYEEFMTELANEMPDTILVIGEKKAAAAKENNWANVCKKLDTWTDEGVYSCEEYEDYFVYQLKK